MNQARSNEQDPCDELLLSSIHDLRTYLRRSLIHAQLIEKHPQLASAPALSPHVDEIISANRGIETLLSRLGQYASARSYPATPLVDVGLLFSTAHRKLTLNVDEVTVVPGSIDSCEVRAPYSFEAVIRELLDNAAKFRISPVVVSVLVEKSKGDWLFGVKDNGIGFDPQFAEKIKRPLERLHPPDIYPGTGMGLAICDRAIEAWGGKFWSESKLESGSTFWFSLPN